MESRMEAWRVERRVYIVVVEVVGALSVHRRGVVEVEGKAQQNAWKEAAKKREGETEVKEKSNGP